MVDAALDHVGIDLNAAVVEEARKAVPARERVADCLGQFGLLADQGELGGEPGFEVFNDRPAPGLARGTSLVDAAAGDLLSMARGAAIRSRASLAIGADP